MHRLVLITISALALLTSATPRTAAQEGRGPPLAERLGGDREGFEDRYGDPVSDDELVRYETPGYGAIDVLYHKGYVLSVTLIADRPLDQSLTKPGRGDWTVEEARELTLTFLPRDVEQRCGTAITDEGDLVGILHIPALAERFSAATYRQYEAGGRQGDCRYLLIRNKEGGVAAITVSIGNAEAGVTTPEATAAPTAEERAYLRELEEPRDLLEQSLSRYDELMADPRPDDPTWLNQLVYAFIGWVTSANGMPAGDPPPRHAELGATCEEAAAALDAVARAQAPGIDAWLAGEADTFDLVEFDLAALQIQVEQARATVDECFALLDAAKEAEG